MSATSSPVEPKLPTRSSTVTSSLTAATRRHSNSEDEAIPDSDSNETTNLLLERLRAWKHMCGYLEDYVSVTAKVQKSQSKDYEKVLKTVSDPLKEGHHFSQSVGGVSGMFENIRSNTQGMVNMYLDTEKNLKGSLLPTLERLHKEIKNKSKELQAGASKGAKAVEKARGVTQKHIELLAQQTASFDAAAGNKIEQSHDPYILRRGVNHRLNKQVIEENNNRQDILAVQNNFQQFESHVLQTVQGALDQFFQFMGGQADRQRAMYADILGSAQKIPPDFEWVNFITRNDNVLVNPDDPPRSLANINFPNQDHRATTPLIEGSLERKSRAMLKGYSSSYYVVTPARYLHEFKDDDDFRRDPAPELSLYLPDCVIGALDGVKLSVKGKDVSGSKVGNAFHTTTELNFKAHTANDAEKWWNVIKDATRGPPLQRVQTGATTGSQPASPAVASPAAASPAAAASAEPPAYNEKEKEAEAQGEQQAEKTEKAEKAETPSETVQSPTSPAISRTASTATGHFHTSPGGSATGNEKA
ncbi:hypothetical protein ASPWEDRAFT_121367 [Aspergillus wentii DTO 134E9]|uniref:PH domain-containing protein n=1 Tax=Aspergillus wentii DTO 134E9 TaxID=1073089 RepID=A0A1L9R6B0_ASPWE|nr:uncharacterized protein ASPWEDRAFT_121367 [Aspergillus wentii DTO 134E9]KAI9926881.1 hypothetical protein MW887_003979 [Aspergillus wentii]OJJ30449.1 hypothetical protein ASPWEDRAFT_121367 [Aspergillus wentii DTO 134E9]